LLHNDKTTPREIMEIAQVSESTIRTVGRLLAKLKDDLVTPGMAEKGADKSRIPDAAEIVNGNAT